MQISIDVTNGILLPWLIKTISQLIALLRAVKYFKSPLETVVKYNQINISTLINSVEINENP